MPLTLPNKPPNRLQKHAGGFLCAVFVMLHNGSSDKLANIMN